MPFESQSRIVYIIELLILVAGGFVWGVSYGLDRARSDFQKRIVVINHEIEELHVKAQEAAQACNAVTKPSPLGVTILDDGGTKLRVETKVLPK